MRKVYLEDLPRKEGVGALKGKEVINWKESIGHKVDFIYDDIEGEVEIIGYNYPKITVLYNLKKYSITSNCFKSAKIENIVTIKGFKVAVGDRKIIKNKELEIVELFYRKDKNGRNKEKYIKYKCLECNEISCMSEARFIKNKSSCPICGKVPKRVVKGINDIATTHPQFIKYFVNIEDVYNYSYGSEDNIKLKCPNCKEVKFMTLSNLTSKYKNGFTCNSCSSNTSTPERFIYALLTMLNEDFITQYCPKWAVRKKYDFYIPSLNMIIETHGLQHYKEANRFKRSLSKEQENDKLKRELALNNGIKHYIELDCRYSYIEWLKNKTYETILKNIYNLDLIDWDNFIILDDDKIELEKICRFKNENPNMSCRQISLKLHKSREKVLNYLTQGNQLGLCSFTKEEDKRLIRENMSKAQTGVTRSTGRKVYCFELEMEFDKLTECIQYIKNNYDIVVDCGSLTKCCQGKLKQIKGYTFKYVE